LKRRQHAEANPREHRYGRDEHHRQAVHTDVLEEWDAGALEMRDQARAAERERQSQRRAAAGERQALDEQLTDQTPASGAERHPQRHSLCRAAARARSRFEMFAETSSIRNSDRGRQHRKRAVESAADAVLQRTEVRTERVSAPTGFDLGCRAADAIDSRCRFDGGGRQIDPRFQSADQRKRVPLSIGFRTQGKGEEQVGGRPGENVPPKSNDGGSTPTTVVGAPSRVIEPPITSAFARQMALPERVAQDRRSWCAPPAFLGSEVSSEPGTYAQHRKEALGHGTPVMRSGSPVPVSLMSPYP
jgi:hypothetical protein